MDIWQPDPTPEIAGVERAFTDALSNYLYRVHIAAHRELGLGGVDVATVREAYRAAHLPLAKAEQPVSRAARLFAELLATPREARRATTMADALSQQWFEHGLIHDQAERAVVRAAAQGRIEAARSAPAPAPDSDPSATGTVLYALERAAVHVTRLRDTTRGVLASAVQDALLRGDSPQTLAADLVSRFGTLNRDARRLAITEVAFARASGFLQGIPAGESVQWFDAAGCCPACRKLSGRVFRVVRGAGDPETEVWPGKHNVGLSAAERTPAIPLHPHCRCRWIRAPRAAPAGVSERLTAALAALEYT